MAMRDWRAMDIRWAAAALLLLTLPIGTAEPVSADSTGCAACNLHHQRLADPPKLMTAHGRTVSIKGHFH
jgi:hypothetical protein